MERRRTKVSGNKIDNRYKIKKLIGTGGMAKVFLARDMFLDRDVAVKLLASSFIDDQESLKRFQREAISTTELSHENIVSIYDVGEGAHPFIVMEFVDGTDLKTYIKDHYPIPNDTIIDIMSQILNGIEYAHSRGIIHRDIKPQNILMDSSGQVKITDFGIALAVSQHSITQTNSLLGTVHYMSPEQAKGGMATQKSDIYSLGIVLYELLTGQVPFSGESPVSIALKHFQEDLPDIREQNPNVPQSLANVVLKATCKDPDLRYDSAYDMRQDLMTVLDPSRQNEPVFVPKSRDQEDTIVMSPIGDQVSQDQLGDSHDNPTGPGPRPSPATKKKRRWPLVLALIILALLLGGIVYFIMSAAPNQVELPDLENRTLEEAETILADLQLQVDEVIEEPSEEIEEGHVTRSNPGAGTKVDLDTEIDLFVSTGSDLFSLEDYTGRNYEEVRAILTEIGFTVESREVSHNDIESGQIVSQDLSPGQEVKPEDTTITFDVSTGPEGFAFRDLTGYTRVGVDDYIADNNLNLTVDYQSSDQVEEGLVVDQSPEPGATLFENDSVTVIFSTGPAAGQDEEDEGEEEEDQEEDQDQANYESFSRLVQIQYQPSGQEDDQEDPVPNEIEVYIDDEENSMDEPVLSFEITEDVTRTLNFVVKEGESASYRIVRDGQVIREEEVQNI